MIFEFFDHFCFRYESEFFVEAVFQTTSGIEKALRFQTEIFVVDMLITDTRKEVGDQVGIFRANLFLDIEIETVYIG